MSERLPLVMIVDDSRTFRALFSSTLQQEGFRVVEAGTGEDALDEIKRNGRPDAVILDIEMPGMGGFETCKQIRQLPDGNYIPVMISTGLEDYHSITKAFESGATDFVTKPMNWDLIGRRMHYMIRNNKNLIALNDSRTEILETQEKIKGLNAELEQRVISRTKMLEQTNNELRMTLKKVKEMQDHLVESEKMASLGTLVAGIAHEVNTPIGIAVTAVSHLEEKLDAIDKAIQQKALTQSQLINFLKASQEAVNLTKINLEHATELIKSFKQVSVDQASESYHEFLGKEYLGEIVYSLQPVITKNSLQVNISCPEDLRIESYPGVLFQVLTILVMNSIQHGYKEGEGGEIIIDMQAQDGEVTLSYADKGKGVSEENLKKIFDPFFTTKRSQGSAGLGLHIAYNQITKLLGGTIRCESQLNVGTQFIIRFPQRRSACNE
jgi:signal transduction histidine kinase